MVEVFLIGFLYESISDADGFRHIFFKQAFHFLRLPVIQCIAEVSYHFPVFFHTFLKAGHDMAGDDIPYLPIWNGKAVKSAVLVQAVDKVVYHIVSTGVHPVVFRWCRRGTDMITAVVDHIPAVPIIPEGC